MNRDRLRRLKEAGSYTDEEVEQDSRARWDYRYKHASPEEQVRMLRLREREQELSEWIGARMDALQSRRPKLKIRKRTS